MYGIFLYGHKVITALFWFEQLNMLSKIQAELDIDSVSTETLTLGVHPKEITQR